ncbi:hypothetical protein JHK84_043504 [Glycine max]|nr:hypothetical protein JHK86_043318 [Glycine max]KAG5117391.1 hypothetical protein JHK84_043504 [Glycine max]
MIRCGQKIIIFLINNGGYTIEVEIHDGPYNVIKNWDYTRFVDTIHNGQGKCWTAKSEIELENEGVMTPVREGEERVDEGEGGSGSVTKCIVLESE